MHPWLHRLATSRIIFQPIHLSSLPILEIQVAEIKIQFSTSKAFSSDVIRRLTHSPFSHTDLVVPEGLLGVSGKDDSIHDLGGVMVRSMQAWPYLTTPKVARLQCTDEVAAAVIAAGRSQIGKP